MLTLQRHYTEATTSMEFILVDGGEFLMGTDVEMERYADENEAPQHKVRLNDYYLGKYPVTQQQYFALTGKNPSRSNQGPNHPIDSVSWFESLVFLEQLNRMSLSNLYFYLPSEAEWEYAAKGGQDDRWSGTSDPNNLDTYIWHQKNESSDVDLRQPNPFGFHDMSGNVWEWCSDCWHDNYHGTDWGKAPVDGSPWLALKHHYRVLRGGCWSNFRAFVRCGSRSGLPPDDRRNYLGFRVAACKIEDHFRGHKEVS
jgi:formylglycine-generating enzyme required for sulfatase activity